MAATYLHTRDVHLSGSHSESILRQGKTRDLSRVAVEETLLAGFKVFDDDE